MVKPLIAIASLGGTITMTTDGSGGIHPTLDVEGLLDSVPALREVGQLVPETLGTLPGASLEFSDLFRVLDWARSAVNNGASGVVVVQGTDTIEETSYLLDLYWDKDEPLVVTGAMRAPQTPGSDGPANLLASALVASAPDSRGLGVLVVMNDEVHAASRVRKMRASGTNAFKSPSFGPIGYVEEKVITYGSRPRRWPCLVRRMSDQVPNKMPKVALLEATLGDDGALLDAATATGFEGIVIAGFGVGHVSRGMVQSVDGAVALRPVILASRTGAGTTLGHTYSFEGSESDLLARGVIGAGWLDARKARVLLSCLIAGGCTRDGIHSEFAQRGQLPGGDSIVEKHSFSSSFKRDRAAHI